MLKTNDPVECCGYIAELLSPITPNYVVGHGYHADRYSPTGYFKTSCERFKVHGKEINNLHECLTYGLDYWNILLPQILFCFLLP